MIKLSEFLREKNKSAKHLTPLTNKKAQIMGMPFEMLFSLILIAIFIVVVFFVIRTVLIRAEQARIVMFEQELSGRIENVWMKTDAKISSSFDLPVSIKYVCFSPAISDPQADFEGLPDDMERQLTLYSEQAKDSNALFFFPTNIPQSHGISPFMKITCGEKKAECLDLSSLKNPYCIQNTGKISLTFEKKIGDELVKIGG